jgi:hypothetical protein
MKKKFKNFAFFSKCYMTGDGQIFAMPIENRV